ncbi:immunity 22 family protein [Oceanospirillum beijerinckii]|uniref:immunity 22 family protein n=1 Tax=Oceanospirillum beijerinckii TaxID=64976 RepID=UPI00047F620D|nr:immunity 22 family protein [Oceanospirillum beijerinckii]
MFENKPFFTTENHWVTVWIGSLNEESVESYLEECGVDDDEPISQFSKDLGCWYDHDFIWYEAVDSPVCIEELCRNNGVDSIELIEELTARSGGGEYNCFIMLWNSRLLNAEDDRAFFNGKLSCIGSWQHESPLVDDDY